MANSAPIIDPIASISLNEQIDTAPLAVNIPVTFVDADLSSGHKITITNAIANGAVGGLGLNPAELLALISIGTITQDSALYVSSLSLDFSAFSTVFDYLAAGESLSIIYTIQVDDLSPGGVTTGDFVVTVTGTNDAPIITAGSTVSFGAVIEDAGSTDLTFDGVITFSDVDLIDNHSANVSKVSGILGGTLSVGSVSEDATTAPGTFVWNYSVANSATQFLGAGEISTEKFTVSISDSNGGVVDQMITITVTGSNDAPVVQAATDAVIEDNFITGQLFASDVDHLSSATFALDAPVAGLSLDAAGNYKFETTDAAYQALAAGEKQVVVAGYTVTDDKGATNSSTLTITVTGSNDAPVAQAATDAVIEDNYITGQLLASDVDHLSSATFALDAPVAGLSLDAAGNYVFDTAHAAYQALAAGEKLVVVAGYTVTDDQGATNSSTLTITVTGSNDTPVAQAATSAVIEDNYITGQLFASDADILNKSATFALDAPIAGLSLDAAGNYVFDTAHAAYQALAAGEKQVVVAGYTVTDDQGATSSSTLTITVTGSNDVPVAQAATAAVIEDNYITGQLLASDVDHLSSATYALDAPVAGLNLDAAGNYVFDAAHAAYQYLSAGEKLVVSAGYTVTDDQGATSSSSLTITVTGSNDAPVAQAATAAVIEDNYLTGQLLASDVDHLSSATYALDAPIAGLSLDSAGNYVFDTGHAAYQYLSTGEKLVVTAGYTVTDDQGATNSSTLTITVTGSNDVPVAQAATAAVIEDNYITGQLLASDVDHLGSATYALDTPVAGLSLDAAGNYVFDTAHAAYQALAAGEKQVVVAGYTVTDDQGATSSSTLTITVTGSNDVPVAQAATAAVIEDNYINGQLLASDVDHLSSATYTLDAPVAGLSLDAAGNYVFDAAHAAYQYLSAGEKLVVSAGYTVTDDQGATSSSTLTITVTGSNDAPVAQVATAAVIEDNYITGQLFAGDADILNKSATYALDAPVAGLTLDSLGNYKFDATHTAYQYLSAGEKLVVVAGYTVTDDQGASSSSTLANTVTGSNDAPVAQAAIAAVIEDNYITGQLLAGDADILNKSATYALDAPVAGLTLDSLGNYKFDATHTAYQYLSAGEKLVVVAGYTVTDDQGASSSSTLANTVTGSNDAPVAQAAIAAVIEDNYITGQLLAGDADILNKSATYALDAPVAGLTLDSLGNYKFDATHTAYQYLSAGEKLVVVAGYTVTDDQGATSSSALTITVTGSNDAPVAQAATDAVVEDNYITGQLRASDVDHLSSATFALDAPVAGLSLDAVGNYKFETTNASYQALAAGEKQVVVAGYTVTDDKGATSSSTLTITVTGSNDVPVAQAATDAVIEDNYITGQLLASDVDHLSSVTFALDAPVAGLSLDAAGNYKFETTDAAYQALAAGEKQVVVVGYTVADDKGATSSSTLTITVTGSNDAPVAQAATAAVIEDNYITGQLLAGDVDHLSSATFALDAPFAGLSLDAAGNYKFETTDAAYQALAAGEKQVVVAGYTVTDDKGTTSSSTLTITVTGSNDAPVAQAATAAVIEDSYITGQLLAGDVDHLSSAAFALNAPVAGLSLDAAGNYVFDTAHAAYQYLSAGEKLVVSAGYTVTDDQGATSSSTLTITVTGSNDAPVAQAAAAAVIEDNYITGQLFAGDVDHLSSATYALDAPVAGLSLDAAGNFKFETTDAAYQALAAGEKQVIVAGYTVTDDQGATSSSTLMITVTGSNDAPVAQAATAAVIEDNYITGQLFASDADILNKSATFALDAPVAGLSLDSAGNYVFVTAHAAYQALAVGEKQVVVAGYTVTDDQGATSSSTLTITVTGSNDAPVAQAATDNAVEDGEIVYGELLATDIDVLNRTATYVLDTSYPLIEGLTLAADGKYSFDPTNPVYQQLAYGEILVLTAGFTVTDDQGASDNSTLTINVTGTNDAPVFSHVPVNAQVITAGQAAELADFMVSDVDSVNLNVTLIATNGVINGLTDLDTASDGVQLAGTAEDINSAIAAATFTATAMENVTISLEVTDKIDTTASTYAFSVDNAGISPSVEAEVPSLSGGGKGDGNGDGIQDRLQLDVISTLIWNTTTVSNPGAAPETFITLVADSKGGLIDLADSNSALLTSVQQFDAPASLPLNMNMPLGLLSFSANVEQGTTETFSLFIDKNIDVNGYWSQNASGMWVNLSTKVEVVGDNTRIDFTIADNSIFDVNHTDNGVIEINGAAGSMPLSIVGSAPDSTPSGLFSF
jgi:VCBS repeat-containing protein